MKNLKIKLIFLFIFIGLIIFLIVKPYLDFINHTLKISLLKTLFSKNSLKTYNQQLNILLMGISGENHDGPNLSDSLIVFNYNFKTNKLTSISIPRDIWSETLKDKINSAYAYGEAKKPNQGGFILAKAEVSSIIGQPIQYAAVINFEQFKNLIDFLGGIEVEVENSFIDKKFPIQGKENDNCDGDQEYRCRYETISFKKGKILMNGETALKFVRSRNADGIEGTDFAREKRQQKVIFAIEKKLLSKIKNINLENYKNLYQIINNLIKRDISNQQLAIIFKNIIFNKNKFQMKKITLSEDFFINPPLSSEKYNHLWVLIPKDNDFSPIHQYILCQISDPKECSKK